jgi:hypothetical protein
LSFPTACKRTVLPGARGHSGLPIINMSLDYSKDLKKLLDVLSSIDISLQMISHAKSDKATAAFISKKSLAARLNVAPVVIDKLIHTGIASGGTAGLVEGIHYCKLDPSETNTSAFLFDAPKVLEAAWQNFANYKND